MSRYFRLLWLGYGAASIIGRATPCLKGAGGKFFPRWAEVGRKLLLGFKGEEEKGCLLDFVLSSLGISDLYF